MPGIIDRINVTNRVVMITGAGQGIGRVYAREFARAGAQVGIADLDAAKVEAVAAEITREGGRAFPARIDVAARDSVQAATTAIAAKLGPIEVLINNAAIFTALSRHPFDEIPFEEFERVMRVNVIGSWLCAAAVAAGMRSARWGRIINISSSTVPLGLPPHFAHYVTSKAAVIGLTRTLATELGPHGVTVNSVLPGMTETEVPTPGRTDALRAKILEIQRIKRVETPEDLVGMMLFLASPAADFITGQSILVDGGTALL